jgi:hypothetical protein
MPIGGEVNPIQAIFHCTGHDTCKAVCSVPIPVRTTTRVSAERPDPDTRTEAATTTPAQLKASRTPSIPATGSLEALSAERKINRSVAPGAP